MASMIRYLFAGAAAAAALVLAAGMVRTDRNTRAAWAELTVHGSGDVFDPASVADLPPPARRFLLHAIEPGTPLAGSAELAMHGDIRLAPDREPMPFRAEQILAPPRGFIWQATAAQGLMRISGYDRYVRDAGEVRWRLWGVIPVARGSGADVTRSAAGRLAMEAVLMPSSLVPGRGATWEPVDESSARFRLTIGPESVTATLVVDADGRPRRIHAMRWSEDAGPGYDVFGVDLAGQLHSGGYTIPARIEAGWRLGGPDEFRFFRAELDGAAFR